MTFLSYYKYLRLDDFWQTSFKFMQARENLLGIKWGDLTDHIWTEFITHVFVFAWMRFVFTTNERHEKQMVGMIHIKQFISPIKLSLSLKKHVHCCDACFLCSFSDKCDNFWPASKGFFKMLWNATNPKPNSINIANNFPIIKFVLETIGKYFWYENQQVADCGYADTKRNLARVIDLKTKRFLSIYFFIFMLYLYQHIFSADSLKTPIKTVI